MKTFALVPYQLIVVLLAALPQVAMADTAAKVRLSAFKVTSIDGGSGAQEKIETLQGLNPGDTIEYRAVVENTTGKQVKNVQITLPVPPGGLQYLLASASPRATSASIDGLNFEPVPLMRTEQLADGSRVRTPVPASAYRFLRWSVGDLPNGATRSVNARMQLPALLPASAGMTVASAR